MKTPNPLKACKATAQSAAPNTMCGMGAGRYYGTRAAKRIAKAFEHGEPYDKDLCLVMTEIIRLVKHIARMTNTPRKNINLIRGLSEFIP